jgi:hypothetical protein
MLKEKDPIARALFAKYKNVVMPNQRLTDSEVSSLLGFMERSAVADMGTEQVSH